MTLVEARVVTKHALRVEGHVGDAIHTRLISLMMTEQEVRKPRRMNALHRRLKVRSGQHSSIVGRSSRCGTVTARRRPEDLLIKELQLSS